MALLRAAALAGGLAGLLVGATATWLATASSESGDISRRTRSTARLDYVELPVADLAASRTFYERAFGWGMTQFGSNYAATMTNDTDVGLASDPAERPKAPLAIIQVEDLEAALASVEQAGGTIVRP